MEVGALPLANFESQSNETVEGGGGGGRMRGGGVYINVHVDIGSHKSKGFAVQDKCSGKHRCRLLELLGQESTFFLLQCPQLLLHESTAQLQRSRMPMMVAVQRNQHLTPWMNGSLLIYC